MNYNAACEVKNLTSPSLEFVPSVLRRWLTILIACGLSSRTPSMGQAATSDLTAALATLDITRSQCHCVTRFFTIKFSERSSCSRPARLRTRTTTSSPPRFSSTLSQDPRSNDNCDCPLLSWAPSGSCILCDGLESFNSSC